jgi:hypothetical protein
MSLSGDQLNSRVAFAISEQREHLRQVVEDRFAELSARVRQELESALSGRAAAEVEAAGRRPAEERAIGPNVPREEEKLHLLAQRFARVRAAEIRLYKSQAVEDGRARKKLYSELKEEIDSARAAYEREYLRRSASMPDYLHLELVRTLANEEVAALGEEYPGPLA